MKFKNLTLREKVCQLMAPRAKDYIKDGCDSATYPVGFIFVDNNDYKPDEQTGIRNVDAATTWVTILPVTAQYNHSYTEACCKLLQQALLF